MPVKRNVISLQRPMENPMDVATDWLGCPEKTEVEAIDREPARNEPSQYNSEINDGNKASDMTLQGSSHGEGRDNDEQLMAVQDKNDVLGQRSVATYQQCGHCLGLGLLAALSVVLLGN